MRIKSLHFHLFLLMIALAFSLEIQGQSSVTQERDSLGQPIVAAIPVQDLIQKIEEANEEIKIIERKIKFKEDILHLDTVYPEYAKFIRNQRRSAQNFIKSNPNRQKINNQIKKWNGYDDHLSQWESVVDQYEERNVKLLEGVKINEKIWDLTYQTIIDQKLPAEVVRSVRDTRRDFQKLRAQIVRENNKYLLLESRINGKKSEISEVVENLEKLKESPIYDLLYLRHEPLWKSDFGKWSALEKDADKGVSFDENYSGIPKYFRDSGPTFLRFIFYTLLIVVFVRWVKRNYEKYEFSESDKNLLNAKKIIVDHARESAVFLSLLLATFLFENPPTLLFDLFTLLVLITSIPLVRPFMRERFKGLLYLVILIFLLDTIKTYIWFTSLQYRTYLLMEAVLVIAVLFRFAFSQLTHLKHEQHKFGALLIRLAPVLQLLALISIVSNIMGYTNLTDLTLKICTQSGVYTVIFYGLLMVTGGLTTGVIHEHYSSRNIKNPMQRKDLQLKTLQFIRVVTVFIWTMIFLSIVDLLDPLEEFMIDALTEPYIFGSITLTIGDILRFLGILALAFFITSLVTFLFDSGQFKVKYIKLPKGIPAAISLVVRYFIIASGIILALSSLGVDLSKFNLMAGALGLGIGFGLQNVISNFVSGLILVFERPILVGDTIEVNNLIGTVNRIGVRSSNISTFDGAEVVVPNSNLISNDLINWTLSSNIRRIEILIGVAYGTDLKTVLEVLMDVVKGNDDILKDPEPQALFSDFGDSSLNFKLRFWVPFEVGLQAKSDVSVALYDRFKELKIEIPFPQRDIHIKTVPQQMDGDASTTAPQS